MTLYQQRPKVIETLCLADFISMRRNKKAPNHCGDLMEELPETEYEEDNSDDIVDDYADVDLEQTYMFKNGTEIVKRKKQSILRWVHFDVETDSEKYYRELLMLFTQWRNEGMDLIKTFGSYQERYMSCKEKVERKRRQYEKGDVLINEMENVLSDPEGICMGSVSPENEHQEQVDIDEGVTVSKLYGCFDPG